MKKLWFVFILVWLSSTIFSQSSNFTEGKKALDSGDLDVALEYFSKDILDNPNRSLTYYYRALIYYDRSEYARAMNDVTLGIKNVNNKNKELKGVLYELRAKVNIQIDEPEKALADYTTAIKTYPRDPDFFIGRAHIYFMNKLYNKAEADYLSILKFDETNAAAFAGLGRNFINQRKFVEADKLLMKLKKLHPEYDNAYYYSAISNYLQGKYEDAIENSFMAFCADDNDDRNRDLFIEYSEMNFDYALSKITQKTIEEPENFYWIFYKGVLQQNKKDFCDAIVSYTKALKLMVEPNEIIISRRALCYQAVGLQDLAITDYDYALGKDSTRSYDYANRADSKRLQGNYKEAVKDITRAIELNARESWFYYRRGLLYDIFLKNNTLGLRDYNKAIELNNEYLYAYLYRGRMYKQKLNDIKKAIADFETILKLDTVISNHGNSRQYALVELGRQDEAIDWMNKILDNYPDEGNYYNAVCLYSLMNKQSDAVKYLTLAFENGFKDIPHLMTDDDLDNVRNNPEFLSIVAKWKKIIDEENQKVLLQHERNKESEDEQTVTQLVVVPMINNSGGTYEVACKINDLPLNFIFDTGASDISISQTEVQFMLKNKYLSKADILGSQSYIDATGNVSIGTKIILRKVEIGDFVLKNIEASVVNNKKAPLLFGQSALGKYAKILIDNENKTITISNNK